MVAHCCQPVWDEFLNAAAREGLDKFPTSTELLEDRRGVAPVEWQLPELEWVDPTSEQNAAQSSIDSFMSTYQDEIGARGGSWRAKFYQAAKERKLRMKLGLLTTPEQTAQMMAKQTESATAPTGGGDSSVNVAAQALNGAQVTSLVDVITQVGTGAMPKDTAKPVLQAAFPTFSQELIDSIIDPVQPGTISADGAPTALPESQADQQAASGVYMGLSTQQWNRNRKAIQKTLDELAAGTMKEPTARVFLKTTGMPDEHIDVLIADALDGLVETQIPNEEVPA
jgi:hypothetical protein